MGRKLTPFVILKRKNGVKRKRKKNKALLVKLHLNVTERVTDKITYGQMFGTENQVPCNENKNDGFKCFQGSLHRGHENSNF
jgi:hypothetical protein